MRKLQPLLLELFHALRREQLPLGVDEYRLALEVLWSGHGLEDLDDLRYTLRLLWAKSLEDQQRFDAAFDLYLLPLLASPSPSPPLPEPPAQPLPEPAPAVTRGPVPAQEPAPPQQSLPGLATPPDVPLLPAVGLEQAAMSLAALGGVQERAAPTARATYRFTPRLPIPRREMSGIWRHLRRLQREGPAVELDVEGTIAQISRQGFLLQPLMQPLRRNQARLLLLLDCFDTMAPFAPVTQALIHSARAGGLLGRMAVFYFSHVPDAGLAPEPDLADPRPVGQVLAAHARGGSVLIVSDGGAAPGLNSGRSVTRVSAFLQALHGYTYRYAWLNPFPPSRWPGTTAGEIATLVPMFPLDRDGLVDAVNILRGHPFPPGIGFLGRG